MPTLSAASAQRFTFRRVRFLPTLPHGATDTIISRFVHEEDKDIPTLCHLAQGVVLFSDTELISGGAHRQVPMRSFFVRSADSV